ncbi:hypothetical protein Taro_014708, partial [Colocasia esculenta]|nr:hypothetical protein [Colocasia esculenta]
MVQRAQLVEDTLAKLESFKGRLTQGQTTVRKGGPDTAGTFRYNNNNNKRPNVGRDTGKDKKVQIEGRAITTNCKLCDKLGHQAEECWKKLGACLRCGGRDPRIPDCPMMKEQPGKGQIVPRTQLGSVARRPVTTEALNPNHVCTLQTLSLASGPRPAFPLRLTLAVEKGLHGDRLKTTKRSTHRTELHSMSRLTSGGQPHASRLDGVALTP